MSSERELPVTSRLEAWLATHRSLVVASLVLVALFVRVVHFAEMNESPAVGHHRAVETDMHFFDLWARRIASGDVLTDGSLHPYCNWHRLVAEDYLRLHPGESAGLEEGSAARDERSRALWNRWYGEERFHQAPLYAYSVALIYTVLGDDVRWVFAVQMVLGVVSLVLLHALTRKYFGHVAALAAAALWLSHPLFLFYETVLLRVTLIVFMGLLTTWLLTLAEERGGSRRWLVTGIAAGTAILVKPTFGLLAAGALVLLVASPGASRGERARHAALLLLGVLLPLVPLAARNRVVGSSTFALSSVGAVTFLLSNAEDYEPDQSGFLALNHAAEVLAETDGRFVPTVVAAVRTHPDLLSYAWQLTEKFLWLMHWYERPSNANFYYFRAYSAPLRWLPGGFVLIVPIAVLGLALSWRRLVRATPLVLLLITALLPLLVLFSDARYRLVLVSAILPLAGCGVAHVARIVGERRLRAVSLSAGVLIALGAWISRPLPAGAQAIHPVDYIVPYATFFRVEEARAVGEGDMDRAADVLESSLRAIPPEIRALGPGRPARTRGEAELAAFYSLVHIWCADALERAGRTAAAGARRERAVELREAARAAGEHRRR